MAHTADKDDWSHRFDQILQISKLAISKYSLENETQTQKRMLSGITTVYHFWVYKW